MTDFWRDSAKLLRLSPRLQGVLQLLLHELLRSNITFHRPPKRNTPCYWVEPSLQQHSQGGVVRTALFNAVHGYLDTWRNKRLTWNHLLIYETILHDSTWKLCIQLVVHIMNVSKLCCKTIMLLLFKKIVLFLYVPTTKTWNSLDMIEAP